MGWFNKRAEAREREEQLLLQTEEREKAEAADPKASLKCEFAAAVERGGLDDAAAVLNRYLDEFKVDGGPAEYESGPSLLERAAPARRALNDGQLDAAAEILSSWKIQPPSTSTFGPERLAQLPNLNTLGMLLIDFFSSPGVESHPRYDALMDTQLKQVAQWTRLSSPRPQPGGFFDRVYADIKSKRELSRRAASPPSA
jgi:hypothetical protein